MTYIILQVHRNIEKVVASCLVSNDAASYQTGANKKVKLCQFYGVELFETGRIQSGDINPWQSYQLIIYYTTFSGAVVRSLE